MQGFFIFSFCAYPPLRQKLNSIFYLFSFILNYNYIIYKYNKKLTTIKEVGMSSFNVAGLNINFAEYKNLRDTLMEPIIQKVSNSTNSCISRETLHIPCIFVEVGYSAIDTVIGIAAAITSVVVGTDSNISSKFIPIAQNHLASTRKCLSNVFFRVLNSIDADIQLKPRTSSNGIIVCSQGDGIFTGKCRQILTNIFRSTAEEDVTPEEKHIYTRICYLAFGLAAPLLRTADFAIGILAVIAAIVAQGWIAVNAGQINPHQRDQIDSLNNLAYRGLQIGGIVDDLFFSLINFQEPGKIKA